MPLGASLHRPFAHPTDTDADADADGSKRKRSLVVTAATIVLVGTEPEGGSSDPTPEEPVDLNATPPPPEKKFFASDHFGLHATFQL